MRSSTWVERWGAQSLEAEQALLGAALMSRTAQEVLLTSCTREDFYRGGHRLVFDAIASLAAEGKSADTLLLTNRLQERNQLDAVGGMVYVGQLAEAVPTAVHAPEYATVLRDLSARRRALEIVEGAGAYLERHDRAEAAVEEIIRDLDAVRVRHATPLRGLFTARELAEMDIPEPEYVLPGIIPVGLTLLAGKPKTGKSFLAFQLALAVANGTALGDLHCPRADVLYLALEDGKFRLQGRMFQILADDRTDIPTHELPDNLVIGTEWRQSDDGGLGDLETYCREKHPKLVIIDILAKYRSIQTTSRASVYDLDYKVLGGLQSLAMRHGVAVVVLHHMNKSNHADILDAISGSAGVPGAADSSLVLKRSRNESFATLYVTGRDVREQEIGLEWDDRCYWRFMGNAGAFLATREQEAILEALRDAPMAPAAIASELRVGASTVRMRLRRMVERGLVAQSGALYYIAPQPEETPARKDIDS